MPVVRPLRVCMITTSYPRWPGDLAGTFVESLAQYLTIKHNVAIQVLAPADTYAPATETRAGITVKRLQYFWPSRFQKLASGDGIPWNLRRHKLAWVNIPSFLLSFAWHLCLHAKNADIIHAYWGILGALAVITKPIHRRPVIVSPRGSDIQTDIKPIRWTTSWAIRRADAVIANAPPSYRYCCIVRGTRKDCYLIYNGVRWQSDENLEKLRRAQKRKGNRVNIISVGRLIPERRHCLLVRAFAEVLSRYPDSTLTIVGDGPEFAAIKALAEELGISESVRLPGRVPTDEVSDYLCAADLYVSASTVETFGNAVVEAAAHGLPIITTRVGFPATLVIDGETGYVLKPDRQEALVDAMLTVTGNPKLRLKAGLLMRQRVQDLGLTWSESSRRIADVYKTLVRSS